MRVQRRRSQSRLPPGQTVARLERHATKAGLASVGAPAGRVYMQEPKRYPA